MLCCEGKVWWHVQTVPMTMRLDPWFTGLVPSTVHRVAPVPQVDPIAIV